MHVCAIKCQGCADNTKVPQLGEGQQRISNARLQGIENGGSTWFNMATAAVALLQMTISSAGAGYCQLLHNTQYTSQYICHDSIVMQHYIINGSQLKLRPKRDKKSQCDGKRVWICGIPFNLFTVVQYCVSHWETPVLEFALCDMISKRRKLY